MLAVRFQVKVSMTGAVNQRRRYAVAPARMALFITVCNDRRCGAYAISPPVNSVPAAEIEGSS
jgi:hypothetical protein